MARAAKAATPTNFPVLKDKAVVAAVEDYCAAKSAMELAKAKMDELKPVIVKAMGDAPTAYCGTRVLNHSKVAPLPGTPNREITRAMVGQVIPGQKGKAGYEQLRVQ